MEATDTDSSDLERVNINKFGSKKTSRWNRPKIELPLKDFEKVPTRRSKRIHELKKDKAQTQVQYIFYLTRFVGINVISTKHKYSVRVFKS